MKIDELKKIIRTTIKTEVRRAIREELTEIILGKEVNKSTSLSSLVKKTKKLPKKPKQQYTNNIALNEILNETVGFNGYNATEPDIDETVTLTSDDAPNLRGKFAQMMGLENDVRGGGSLDSNLIQTAASMGRTADQVPPEVATALTRDYSDVMEAIDKKRGK